MATVQQMGTDSMFSGYATFVHRLKCDGNRFDRLCRQQGDFGQVGPRRRGRKTLIKQAAAGFNWRIVTSMYGPLDAQLVTPIPCRVYPRGELVHHKVACSPKAGGVKVVRRRPAVVGYGVSRGQSVPLGKRNIKRLLVKARNRATASHPPPMTLPPRSVRRNVSKRVGLPPADASTDVCVHGRLVTEPVNNSAWVASCRAAVTRSY